MPLKVFNQETTPSRLSSGGNPGISIYAKNGQFTINPAMAKQLSLSSGDQIEFAQDDENLSLWFLSKVKEKGFVLRQNKGEKSLKFTSIVVATAILGSVKAAKGGLLRVAEKPIKMQGVFYYAVDLSLLKKK